LKNFGFLCGKLSGKIDRKSSRGLRCIYGGEVRWEESKIYEDANKSLRNCLKAPRKYLYCFFACTQIAHKNFHMIYSRRFCNRAAQCRGNSSLCGVCSSGSEESNLRHSMHFLDAFLLFKLFSECSSVKLFTKREKDFQCSLYGGFIRGRHY
jgi:hypothetical protein